MARKFSLPIERAITQLNRSIIGDWVSAISRIIDGWRKLHDSGHLTSDAARRAAQGVLFSWPEDVARKNEEMIDRLFSLGFMDGVDDTGLEMTPDEGDDSVIDWLKSNPHGFMPALRRMSNDAVRSMETIIRNAYQERDQLGQSSGFDIDGMVQQAVIKTGIGASRAELIIRTETAKAAAMGRITAWGRDPKRDWYWYEWNASDDDRTKDVSLMFERMGPYSWSQMRHLWLEEHNKPQRVRNRHTGRWEWQTSSYNCRCSILRVPKTARELYHEGRISRGQYEASRAV